jgi:DNA repair exonuclease SbcCD ATPase subunit
MFIKKIRLQSFGRLTGTCDFQPRQCNVLCQDNEFGKTTLMDAVLHALYDFPNTGFKRTDLKPKERYRPWGSKDGFVVELDIVTSDDRELRLRADFARQQPFELTDMQTWQKLPLDGASFGQRYFRMPLPSFTACFFYRQDERDGSGRDDLIRVIEEAAASNQRQQPSSVRQAISALSEAKVHVPEFSADAVQVDTLLKRIDEKLAAVRHQLQELEEEKERRAAEIEQAALLDREITELEHQRARLEHAAALAELHEIETSVRRHQEANTAREQREARLQELEPYAAFDPAARATVQSLLADLRSAGNRIAELEQRLTGVARPELEQVERDLAALPEAAATFSQEQLEQLRTWRNQLADRRRQAADERRRADAMEADLRGRGVPMDELDSAMERLNQLSEAEKDVLLDPAGRRAEAESALAELERKAAEARVQLAQAKIQRNQLRTFTGATVLFGSAFAVAGIVLILANYLFAGSGAIGVALIGGTLLLLYFLKLQSQLTKEQLEPAAAQEVSLNGDAQKLKEQVAELRGELDEVCAVHALDEDTLKRLKTATQWLQSAGPYQAARDAATRLATEAAGIQHLAAPRVRAVLPVISSDADVNEQEIERATELITRYSELSERLAQQQSEVQRMDAELVDLQADRDAKQGALLNQVQQPLLAIGKYDASTEPELLVTEFDVGCEHAIRLQTLRAEAVANQLLGEEELAQMLGRVDSLRTQKDELEAAIPELAYATLDPRTRAGIHDELAAVDRRREDLRVRRTDLFNECDRVIENWRHEGPRLIEEIERLSTIREQTTEFGESVQIAHRELSDIADQVFRQWATAINERVNQVLPLINPKYKDIACSNELELSAYSFEVGRRLDGRELQHLSKGARDQLQMALRIAVSEYLSSHVGNLPLVFDEPFAHWDDSRFVEGMRFLADLTERHQVILLSCHHWRYEQLRKTHPDLAARLHFCTLCDDKQPTAEAPAGAFL